MSAIPVRPAGTLRTVAIDIKLAHSVFALPFASLAACMAAAPSGVAIAWGRLGIQLVLVVLAMIFAHTTAMLANRLLDRRINARNPRTAGRAIPSGRLSVPRAVTALAAAAGLFGVVCAAFGFLFDNWWPLTLAAPVLAWLGAYPLLKRFTVACHIYLGVSLAISPLAAALAIEPSALAQQPALWWLAGMVLLWVAGFDVIYALQDASIDRADGLHSIPGRFGERAARWISLLLHAGATVCLIASWRVDARFGVLYGIGVAVVAGLLVYEHATVARWGTTRIALAFFTLNGIISCLLGGLGIADVLL